MTLATTADVESLIQTDITDDDDPYLVNMLEQASELITGELGREAEPDTYTGHAITTTLRTREVLLPHWPLASVDAITENGDAITAGVDYHVHLPTGILTAIPNRYWTIGEDIIVTTYTTAAIPGLRTICAAMVVRAFKAGRAFATMPDEMGGLTQLTVGQWSATRAAEDSETRDNPLFLTERELAAIQGWQDRLP